MKSSNLKSSKSKRVLFFSCLIDFVGLLIYPERMYEMATTKIMRLNISVIDVKAILR